MHRTVSQGIIKLVTILLVATAPAHAQVAGVASPEGATSLGSAFSFQGRLVIGGVPAVGSYDLDLRLFDAATGTGQVGSSVVVPGVAVADGLFDIVVDFGTLAFNGNARWIEVWVRPAGSGSYTRLTPRQPVMPVPYTFYAGTAASAGGLECTSCVSSTEIADGAVTKVKLSASGGSAGQVLGTDGSSLAWQSAGGGDITAVTAGGGLTGGGASGAVTLAVASKGIATSMLADSAVTSGKLAGGAVGSSALAAEAVTNDKIAAQAIRAAHFGNTSVPTAALQNHAVTADKLGTGSVDTRSIADGTVFAADLAMPVYHSKTQLYERRVSRVLEVEQSSWTSVACDDANDLPLTGGCDAPAWAFLSIHGTRNKNWDSNTLPAEYHCLYRNHSTEYTYEVEAVILCLAVP